MAKFKDVTIIKEANIYFDGKVTSRSLEFPDGSRKTLGIMNPGEYEFKTVEKEIIEILSGDLSVRISEEEGWKKIGAGESFEIPPKSTFGLRIIAITDYCCTYIK